MTNYFWYSPRGFANEGTLYSYDPGSIEQCAEIGELKGQVAGDSSAVLNFEPKGVDYRYATPWELHRHPERFKPGMRLGSFERV